MCLVVMKECHIAKKTKNVKILKWLSLYALNEMKLFYLIIRIYRVNTLS